MSVYTQTVFAGALPTSSSPIYTVPTNEVFILRDIEVFVYGGTELIVNIGVTKTAGGGVLVYEQLSGAGTTFQWEGRVQLNGGEWIVANATGADQQVLITGYSFPA